MIALAFVAIASSDFSVASTRTFWTILVVLFGAISFAAVRMYADRAHGRRLDAVAILVHWIGVFVAIQCVYLFVGTGRMANADTGLTCGLILALGTFAGGAFGNWWLMIVGAALVGATLVVALFEEYVWVLFGLAVLAVAALVLGSRLIGRRRHVGA
jgi:hypothetical protein